MSLSIGKFNAPASVVCPNDSALADGRWYEGSMPSNEADDTRVASIIACNTVVLALASIGACGRVASQIYMRRFDPDDGACSNP
jgi:hypothetical protein